MPINIDGLITGLDTESIISGLLDIQQQQLDRMALRKNEIQQRQTAFRTVEGRLLSLRSDAGVLSRNSNNPFTRLSVTASDENAISAKASSAAVAGVYRLQVNSTAQAHQVATQGFSDADSEITQGTIEIRLGSGDLKTITIDSNNATLGGLATAINASGSGVSASVIRDSSGGATPYRLLLTGTKTGADNEISVTNNLGADSGSAVKPVINLVTPVQAAADAQVTLGSGVGAISVTSDTNHFEDVVAGVDFDLMQATSGQNLTLTVARDDTAAVDAVESFVESFNAVLQFIDDNSKYNAETNDGGLLLGNRNAARIQQKLRSTILNVVPGAHPSANRLSAVGVTFNDSGRLVLDKSKLETALSGGIDGVTSADIRKLFALGADSTNSGISFVLGSSRTKASTTGYQVDISQAAEQAKITAGTALAASTVITTANRTLELKLDGQTATVSLSEGAYTQQELADHLESIINASADLPARDVKVSLTGGALQLTSTSYGTSSGLTIVSGTSLTDLGLTAGLTDTGRDVVGSFIVNGETEVAVGRGRLLSGDPENDNTADLQLQVTLTPAQILAGPEGTVTVSRGLASMLDQMLGELLHTEDGLLTSVDDGFDAQLRNMQTTIDRQKASFDRQQESLIRQFTALESAISQMQSTSSYLGAQLANLPGFV